MPEYTKDKIADTLMRLLANKSLDKITVKLLVSECGISRQSFYYYFQDILDVTQWLIRKKTNELLQKSLKQEDPRDIVSLYVDFAYDNKEMIGRLLGRVLKKTVSDTGPLSLTDVSTI